MGYDQKHFCHSRGLKALCYLIFVENASYGGVFMDTGSFLKLSKRMVSREFQPLTVLVGKQKSIYLLGQLNEMPFWYCNREPREAMTVSKSSTLGWHEKTDA
jgi:hypothetical protein